MTATDAGVGPDLRSRPSTGTLRAYRAGRNAQQAVIEVEELLFRGHPEVVDADLADYFGSIPHTELMMSVARRIVDRRVLHLIKMWLDCPVEETYKPGRKTTHDRRLGDQQARHSARLTHLTAAGEPLHAPVRVGVEEARGLSAASALASLPTLMIS